MVLKGHNYGLERVNGAQANNRGSESWKSSP